MVTATRPTITVEPALAPDTLAIDVTRGDITQALNEDSRHKSLGCPISLAGTRAMHAATGKTYDCYVHREGYDASLSFYSPDSEAIHSSYHIPDASQFMTTFDYRGEAEPTEFMAIRLVK
jgi:hypothetical protein